MASIQVRNVPEDVHERLKSQASAAGQSLNEYLLARMKEMTEKLTVAEFNARLRAQSKTKIDVTSEEIVQIIREEREAHDEKILRALNGDSVA